MILADDKIWDQNGFNELVRRQLGPSVDDDSGLVYAYDGNLKLGLLPASIFCSGHTYFVQVIPHFEIFYFFSHPDIKILFTLMKMLIFLKFFSEIAAYS